MSNKFNMELNFWVKTHVVHLLQGPLEHFQKKIFYRNSVRYTCIYIYTHTPPSIKRIYAPKYKHTQISSWFVPWHTILSVHLLSFIVQPSCNHMPDKSSSKSYWPLAFASYCRQKGAPDMAQLISSFLLYQILLTPFLTLEKHWNRNKPIVRCQLVWFLTLDHSQYFT